MNKIYIVSALTCTSIFFTSAQARPVGSQPSSTNGSNQPALVEGRAMMVPPSQEGGVGGTVRSGMVTTMPVRMPLPTTGDTALDAKLAVLIQERDAKIKAIDDEYRTKIQSLIGTRPLKAFPMMATGTMMRGGVSFPVQGGVGMNNGRVGSSTQGRMVEGADAGVGQVKGVQVTMNQEPQAPRTPMIIGQQAEASSIVGQGIGAQFNSLFRGIFGRNK
jgi:hypothetical protein